MLFRSISIQPASGLSKDEVERLRREAESHAGEDARRREAVELRNAGDSLAYSAEKTLRDNADKISDDLKQRVEAAVAEVRSVLDSGDPDTIRAATDELSQRMQEIGQAVYGAASASSEEGAAGATAGGGDESTVEGEFREV